MTCPLCAAPADDVLWQNALCRIVWVNEPDYPGFLRVVLNAHVKEMTDLATSDRVEVMRVVFAAETALRQLMRPDKINLASLGNQVPHVHWHVIPRYTDDPHFPNPIWSTKRRALPHAAPQTLRADLAVALNRQLAPRVET